MTEILIETSESLKTRRLIKCR